MTNLIYLRSTEWLDSYEVYKLGKTKSLWDRENSYITSEPKRGYYIMVIEVDEIDELEKQLQQYFQKLYFYLDGATELFNKNIINLIIPFLIKNNINHKVLSEDEINDLTRTKREVNNTSKFIVRVYQRDIINKSIEHYKTNDKGMLVLPCGTGKTFISLLFIKESGYLKICIVVPNLLLLKQWEDNIKLLLPDIPILLVSGNNTTKIKKCIKDNNKFVIITTYHSANKLCKFNFDIIVHDECHHLTTNNITDNKRRFIRALDIESTKKLSLTATIKCIDDKNIRSLDRNYISNDDEELFGKIIDRKSLLWAIENGIVCDYKIIVVVVDKNQLNSMIIFRRSKSSPTLYNSAYVGLKSISDGTSHHMFMYVNSKKSAIQLIKNIKKIKDEYFKLLPIYYTNYTGDMKTNEQEEILNNFKNSTYGIIVCIYCLSEGFDIPLLDSVLFAEPMSSEIRIVQASLRAGRKNKLIPDKITSIILPMLYNNLNEQFMDSDLINKNDDFKKIKEVIRQMGQEDETILQKISLKKCNVSKYTTITYNPVNSEVDEDISENIELTSLLLKNIQRNTISIGYENAIKIIAPYKLNSKESYYKLCEQKISLSSEPEKFYSDKWTNWIDYLSIERKYYDLKTCKIKVNEYLKIYPNIKLNNIDLYDTIKKLCELDTLFPPYDLWCEYYNQKNLSCIFNNKRKKNIIL